MMRSFILPLAVIAIAATSNAACVCKEQQYCTPLQVRARIAQGSHMAYEYMYKSSRSNRILSPPLRQTPYPDHEIFPYVITGPGGNMTYDWYQFRWDLITTAAWSIGQNETICYAHKRGARAVRAWSLGLYSGVSARAKYTAMLANATARAAWVQARVAEMQGADGISIDIEGAETCPGTAAGLTLLMQELRAAGTEYNPQFQISFATPVYVGQPQLSKGYDWQALAQVVDWFIPMGYDMNGMGAIVRRMNITGYGGDGTMADANSPLPGLLMSLGQFADLGVPASKVTMGVGWYGYDYWCKTNVSGAPCHARIGAKQVSKSVRARTPSIALR